MTEDKKPKKAGGKKKAAGGKKKGGKRKGGKKKKGSSKKNASKEPKKPVDPMGSGAMKNAYYICHSAVDFLEKRGFGWPEKPKTKKKRKKKKK
ncbi:small lysine-rich protein 1-like [Corticium candelabrum]|uniref:small lysine-rich protein 1-like n=1 Tax=Corticium candelabrum TaxID=121492 RepID=UPI002E25B9E8|nr:small lysine-rich protein 1-like [Corticium candelabrum]